MSANPGVTEVARAEDGRWLPGKSGNPEGYSGEQASKLRAVQKYALERTYEAMDKVLAIMRASEDDKVALAAAMAVLKVAGCFDKAPSDDAVVARIMTMIAEARAQQAK